MPTSNSQLQKIRALIKSGKRQEAIRQLARLIERDHENAELWWLLANASTDVKQQRQALDYQLSINPNDQRAKQMLNRLEARQVLKQMGIHSASEKIQRNRRPRRRGALVFAVIGFAGVVIALGAALAVRTGLLNRPTPAIPTLVMMATDIPTQAGIPTNTDVVIAPSSTSTTAPVINNAPQASPVNPEITTEAAIPTEEIAVTPETVVTDDRLTTATEETNTLQQPDSNSPEATEDPLTLLPQNTRDNGVGTTVVPQETPLPVPLDPEATSELLPSPAANMGGNIPMPLYSSASTNAGNPVITPPPAATGRPINDVRGQLRDGVERREIIAPYGEQGWQFSAFTGEQITLDLVNITGDGNPSLELRNEDGVIVAVAVNTQNTTTKQAALNFIAPEDSIYTVVVRMAAMTEQLYTLKLTRVK